MTHLGSKAVFQLNQIMTFQTVFSSLKESAGILPHSFLAGYGRVLGMKAETAAQAWMRELNRLNMILRLSIFQGKADFYSLGIHKNLLRNKIINLHMIDIEAVSGVG
ncbi:hypothetical protein [Ewingella americana]|uniref:hypothetical protein n=1 Tax=Ewingella americana TaxID=41202 RepID=UPI0012ADDAEB|nr:hypothetical protein [Ewingella americana]MRT04900.1 hypothetical protein [Ewingella americana]